MRALARIGFGCFLPVVVLWCALVPPISPCIAKWTPDALKRELREDAIKKAKRIFAWGLIYAVAGMFFFGLVSISFAADIGCGRDTDRSGTVDNLCPGDDADFDGYTVAQGDCDDEDWQVFPGTTTDAGCSAGQFRVCAAAGSGYGACTALSSISTAQVSSAYGGTALNIYWLAQGGTTGAGGGTYANPWALQCLYNTGATCYHAPTAGDAYILKAGSYAETASFDSGTRQFYVSNKDGTATNPIYLIGDPTGSAIIVGQGTSGAGITPVSMYESSYWKLDNIEVSGGYNSPIYVNSGDNNQITRVIARDADGNGGAENHSGINISGANDNTSITHSLIFDNYNRAAPTNVNNTQIVIYQGNGRKTNYNVMYTTLSGGAGYGFKWKHGESGGDGEVIGNYVYNTYGAGIAFSNPNVTVKRNLVSTINSAVAKGGTCFINSNQGGTPFYYGSVIEYNTCVDANFWGFTPNESSEAIGANALTIRYNIYQDSKTSYSIEGNAGAPGSVYNYGSDASYTDVVTGGKFSVADNCYYNSASTALQFSVYGNNQSTSLGATYANWSAWQTAGWDSGSLNEDPALEVDTYVSENEDMTTWGYMTSDGAPTTTTTTTTSTTTTTTVPPSTNQPLSARVRVYR